MQDATKTHSLTHNTSPGIIEPEILAAQLCIGFDMAVGSLVRL